MNKYIDAEKLKAEIERRKMPFKKDIEDGVYPTYLCALMDFEEIIDSLQQEQPEVDLEKELEQYARNHPADDAASYRNLIGIARHFYELGLNARKEE